MKDSYPGVMELTTAPGDVSIRRIKSTLRVYLKCIEVAGMEEPRVRFTGKTTPSGNALSFSCKVEYLSELDPFLPTELKRQRDLDGFEAMVLPFREGRGGFVASSLAQAEALEAEIEAALQTAYQDLLDWRKRIEQWTGTREHELVSPEWDLSLVN